MPKPRSAESLLTKLEQMEIGDEIYSFKNQGYISDNVSTVKKRFPGRSYTTCARWTHDTPELPTSSKDFIRVIYIMRTA